MSKKKRIEFLEQRIEFIIAECLRDLENCAHPHEQILEQPAPSVTYVMNATNPANVALDVPIDADGVATHHCSDMLECAMLRYHDAYKVWQLYRDEVLMVAVDFCPYCGADFRNVTISKVKYVYNT